MGILSLIEPRSNSPENPSTPLESAADWLYTALGATPNAAGVVINERTAMSISAVWAAVGLIASSVASLPLNVYKRVTGGKELASDHPLYPLLHDRFNDETPSFIGRETLQGHLGLRGNAYCEKEYNGRGELIGLWPIAPERVTVKRIDGVKVFVVNTNGAPLPLTTDEILHIPGLGYDGMQGYSPITTMKDTLGVAMAAQTYSANFFRNGAEPGGVLSHPKKLTEDAKKNLKASWENAHGTAGGKAHRVAVLEEGLTWTRTTLSNQDSQLIDTRKFQIRDIARIYRVPPHLIGDLEQATFSNIEQQSMDFVMHCLRHWLLRWEQVLNWELFDESERGMFFCEFAVEGMLRADSAARGAFYNQLFQMGVLSPNDIREKENMNPVEGGDKRFVQLNMVPLDKAGDPAFLKAGDTPIAKAGEPPPPAPTAPPSMRSLDAFEPMVTDVLERAAFREQQAAKRAAKRGKSGFLAWVNEYETEQAEYLARSLAPVVRGMLAVFGKQPTDADLRIADVLALTEVRTHTAAYRSLDEPTEQVITDLLTYAGGVTATAKEITERLGGLIARPVEARVGMGAPVVNVATPAVNVNVAPPAVNMDVHVTMPKSGSKTATITDKEGNVRSTITIGTDAA
jgi:HK97 family phage portal protein